MTKSANVFNLIDGLLPVVDGAMISTPGKMQLLYAGIGMPSLRIIEVGRTVGLTDYQAILAANPIRNIALHLLRSPCAWPEP